MNIRQTMRQERQVLSDKTIAQNSQKITDLFIGQPIFKKAKIIASFQATDGEQNPVLINQIATLSGKKLLFPMVKNFSRRLSFGDCNQPMILNKFNILEPKSTDKIPLWLFDIVLIPLTTFDENGNRIGMGGGFYDYSFDFVKWRSVRPKLIGVAHEFQQVSKIIPNIWDVPLDGILTEQKFAWF